jgi:hypothetical protein
MHWWLILPQVRLEEIHSYRTLSSLGAELNCRTAAVQVVIDHV